MFKRQGSGDSPFDVENALRKSLGVGRCSSHTEIVDSSKGHKGTGKPEQSQQSQHNHQHDESQFQR